MMLLLVCECETAAPLRQLRRVARGGQLGSGQAPVSGLAGLGLGRGPADHVSK